MKSFFRRNIKSVFATIFLLCLLVTFAVAEIITVAYDDAITPANGAIVYNGVLPVDVNSSASFGSYTFVDLDSKLSLWLRGEDNVTDGSTVGHTVSWVGTPSYLLSIYSNTIYTSGGAYLTVPDHASLREPNMSFSLWVRSADIATAERWILEKSPHGTNYQMYFTGGKLRLHGGSADYVESVSSFANNTFYHIVGTIEGTTGKIYINGVLNSSGTITGITSDPGLLYFGHNSEGATWDYTGNLDEILIFSRTLSASEVLSLYDSNTNQYNNTFTVTAGAHTIKGHAVNVDNETDATLLRTITSVTATVPTVATSSPTLVTRTTATLNGSVTSDGNASTTRRGFEYGTTTAYGSVASTTSSAGVGSFSENISSLTCATTYHYMAFAINPVGTATTSDSTFTTASCPLVPTIALSAVTGLSRTSAILNASVSDDGGASSTDRGFEYGLTTAYGSVASTTGSGGVGSFTQTVSGLTCANTYHYRGFVINSAGTATTSDSTFTASSCGARHIPVTNNPQDVTVQSTTTATTTTETATTTVTTTSTTTEDIVPILPPPGNTVVEPDADPGQEIPSDLGAEDILKNDDQRERYFDDSATDNGNDRTQVSTEESGENTPAEDSFPREDTPSIFASFVDVTKESLKEVLSIGKESVEKVREIINTPSGSVLTKVVATGGVVTGSVLAVSATAFANPITFSELWLIPTRLLTLLLGALGVRRKNRPWGTVYDSVTKRPLDPAYVTLFDAVTGVQVSSAITDIDGRYGFLVPAGTYKIIAQKTNYSFPSTKIPALGFDEIYKDIYHGEQITILNVGDIITKNIPMDADNFDWNEFAKQKSNLGIFMKRKDITWAKISRRLFAIGFFISLVAVLLAPAPYNYIIVGLYILTIVSNYFVSKKNRVGELKDATTGEPLSFAVVKVYREGDTEPMMKKVANEFGEYYALVPRGRYTVKIDKKNFDGSYTQVFASPMLDIDKGVINFDINL